MPRRARPASDRGRRAGADGDGDDDGSCDDDSPGRGAHPAHPRRREAEASATEDVEAAPHPGAAPARAPTAIWARVALAPAATPGRASTAAAVTDTQLVSPPCGRAPAATSRSASITPTASSSPMPPTGTGGRRHRAQLRRRRHLAGRLDPGRSRLHSARLNPRSGNPLGGRPAYGDPSPAFPAIRTGSRSTSAPRFAGQTVRIRFRIGTDAAVAAPGWTIDNFRAQGITNTPFPQVGTDVGARPQELIANAGRIRPWIREIAILQARAPASRTCPSPSRGSRRRAERHDGAHRHRQPGLHRTGGGAGAVLTFELTIDDGVLTATDTVDIVVFPRRPRS